MPSPRIRIADGVFAGSGAPLVLIAGPDVIESEAHALRMAQALKGIASARGMALVYKSSFDKANRTSSSSFRGPGLAEGVAILARVKRETGLPVTTDFHAPEQAERLAAVVDLLQVPAMLSRQTDCWSAAARDRARREHQEGAVPRTVGYRACRGEGPGRRERERRGVTERGVSFGYNNLVVDFRALPRMRALGCPVCFDATHSVQLPGGLRPRFRRRARVRRSASRARRWRSASTRCSSRSRDPQRAPCDGPSQIPLTPFLAPRRNPRHRPRG
jgi:2-dehydro-3-deoxyphosphooctonate aldolase (KDO 8-P synthase)